jgi:hypothetical protein
VLPDTALPLTVAENAAAVDFSSIAIVNLTDTGWFVSYVMEPACGRNRTTVGADIVWT